VQNCLVGCIEGEEPPAEEGSNLTIQPGMWVQERENQKWHILQFVYDDHAATYCCRDIRFRPNLKVAEVAQGEACFSCQEAPMLDNELSLKAFELIRNLVPDEERQCGCTRKCAFRYVARYLPHCMLFDNRTSYEGRPCRNKAARDLLLGLIWLCSTRAPAKVDK